VRQLARLHGGDAWVEQARGGGARIVIELPAATPAPGFTDEHASIMSATAREPAGRRV
jgi:signal transduction histidine kinase